MKHLLLSCFFLTALFPAISQDSLFVTVHAIYGSKPLKPDENKWFGGILGGHIGLETSPGKVVHFNPGRKVRAFGRKSEPGTYSISSTEQFYCTFGCDSVKRMQVKIPVTAEQSRVLDSISENYHEAPPYPYAFFGMRCTAACYHLLSQADVYPDYRKGKMIRRFFYPRRLRKRLIRSAGKQHWKVSYGEGRVGRKWDHD
jgi:hypothetical protein